MFRVIICPEINSFCLNFGREYFISHSINSYINPVNTFLQLYRRYFEFFKIIFCKVTFCKLFSICTTKNRLKYNISVIVFPKFNKGIGIICYKSFWHPYTIFCHNIELINFCFVKDIHFLSMKSAVLTGTLVF